MKRPKLTVPAIIALWPNAEEFGSDLGLKYRGGHARVMKVRRAIPRQHWPKVLEAARKRNLALTERDLETAHAVRGAA
jgi:hypothetical protein